MKSSEKSPQARELFRIQLRLQSPGTFRKYREHHLVDFMDTSALIVAERGDHGNFALLEGFQEIVLGLNRGATPASGTVKFDDDVGPFFHLDIVHTVFQRMERVETARAAPAQRLGSFENDLRE